MSGNIGVYEARDGMRHHCIYTAVCVRVFLRARVFFDTTAHTVYIYMIVTVQKRVGNKGWRCG